MKLRKGGELKNYADVYFSETRARAARPLSASLAISNFEPKEEPEEPSISKKIAGREADWLSHF